VEGIIGSPPKTNHIEIMDELTFCFGLVKKLEDVLLEFFSQKNITHTYTPYG